MKKSILLVEHDHETRVKIRRILEGAGHFVISAPTGVDGLAMLDKISRPSLIIVATDLPIMNGREFVDHLKKKEKFNSIPITHLAEASEPAMPEACHTITKPVEEKQLLAAVEKC